MGTVRSIKKVIHPTNVDKNNPYSHPSHPNHNPIVMPASKTPPHPSTTPTHPTNHQARATASPLNSVNLIAEARIASGRDPETGLRLRTSQSANELWFTTNTQHQSEDVGSEGRQAQSTHDIRQLSTPEAQAPELSAYNSRAKTQIPKMGTRYDLFIQSLKMKQRVHPNFSKDARSAPPPHLHATLRSNSTPEITPDTSAYISRLSQTRKSMGTRYDLFVKEMRERSRQEREERERRERQFSWYAPERGPVEYYAPGPGRGRG